MAARPAGGMKQPGQAPPPGIALRLAALRALAVPEKDDEARARLSRERPPTAEDWNVAVHRRLGELRALCDLAAHLHRAAPPSRDG